MDVSSFDTAKVTNMAHMFGLCQNLETIYASNTFITINVTESISMFEYDEKLVGDSQTIFNPDYIDKTYARIDNPPDSLGYFTFKQSQH